MARRSSRSGQRDTHRSRSYIANRYPIVVRPFRSSRYPRWSSPTALVSVPDARRFDPDPPVARTRSGRPVRRLVITRFGRLSFRPSLVPSIMTCVRRKVRREVLHALKRTNGGAARRRNANSNVVC